MIRHSALAAILALALVAAPLAGEAQQARMYRVAYVAFNQSFAPRVEAFRVALRELGYVEGQNLTLRVVYAGLPVETLDAVIVQMVHDVDVVVTSFTAAAHATKRAGIAVPVVTAGVADPVGSGLVESLARPRGNITGVTFDASTETSAKRLELFKETVPHMKRLAVLWNVDDPGMSAYLSPAEAWARRTGVDMRIVNARTEAELSPALLQIARLRPDALFVVPTSAIAAQYRAVLKFASERRLPTSAVVKWFTEAGGLMSYTVDERALDARAAHYVDRILKGASPGELPMEQPTTFELVINMKTAKALGLTIPPSLLQRADQVIE